MNEKAVAGPEKYDEPRLAEKKIRGVPVESVVGVFRPDLEPPTDEECRRMIEEERWKRFAP